MGLKYLQDKSFAEHPYKIRSIMGLKSTLKVIVYGEILLKSEL